MPLLPTCSNANRSPSGSGRIVALLQPAFTGTRGLASAFVLAGAALLLVTGCSDSSTAPESGGKQPETVQEDASKQPEKAMKINVEDVKTPVDAARLYCLASQWGDHEGVVAVSSRAANSQMATELRAGGERAEMMLRELGISADDLRTLSDNDLALRIVKARKMLPFALPNIVIGSAVPDPTAPGVVDRAVVPATIHAAPNPEVTLDIHVVRENLRWRVDEPRTLAALAQRIQRGQEAQNGQAGSGERK